ncbi:EAL domain-containing protein [Herbiconiux sp. P18]|uniref:EAL domain-containing protein n=1 Tax=Herbiconiux liangxiaofengii TaxID=3342795 RepID=UPI0035BA95DC
MTRWRERTRTLLRGDSRPAVRALGWLLGALMLAVVVTLVVPGVPPVVSTVVRLTAELAVVATCWTAVLLSRGPSAAPALASAAITTALAADVLVGDGRDESTLLADVAYLAFSLLLLAAVVVLASRHLRSRSSAIVFDALIGSLGFAAVLALVLTPVFEVAASGTGTVLIAFSVAFPALDLLLLAALVGLRASDRTHTPWVPLVLGIALFGVTDVLFALRSAAGDTGTGTPLDAGWVVGVLLIVVWICRSTEHPHPVVRRASATTTGTLLSLASMVAALVVLVVGPLVGGSVIAVALATAALLATVVSVTVRRRSAALNAERARLRRTLNQLRDPASLEQIVVLYQPKTRLSTGAIEGVETLARWNHPGRGLLGAEDFVPLLDEAEATEQWTTRILSLALDDAARWAARGTPLTVAVNVSAAWIGEEAAVADVLPALARRSLPPSALTLEITEQTLVAEIDQALAALEPLRAAGVRLSLDDFGTGFNSLSALHGLAVDEIKIDRSFVSSMETDARAQSLVRATVGLARELGCDSVAEGVQEEAQRSLLRDMGCTFAQGFLIAPPLPASRIDDLLSSPGTQPPSI